VVCALFKQIYLKFSFISEKKKRKLHEEKEKKNKTGSQQCIFKSFVAND